MAKARRVVAAPEPFLRSATVQAGATSEFPFSIPAFQPMVDLCFDGMVTFFVGENGSGKSTLLEAIAVKAGFPATGGGRNQIVDPSVEDSPFVKALRCGWREKAVRGFFLRAETYYDFATLIDDSGFLDPYGGRPLHQQSHGESFLALFENRFRGRQALYLLDEPEAALSPQRQLAFLIRLHDIASKGEGQFIIATHSPILMAYPGSTILQFSMKGIAKIAYRDTEHYQITSSFLSDPDQYMTRLFHSEVD